MAGPAVSLRMTRRRPQSERIHILGTVARRYRPAQACVMSCAAVTPTTGRSAEQANTTVMDASTGDLILRGSSFAGRRSTKNKQAAARNTSGNRPAMVGYQDTIAPQYGTPQKCAE